MSDATQIGSDAVEAVELCCSERLKELEASVRRSPGTYVLGAALFGYLLQFLPLSAIAGGLFRLLFVALRPALIILGIMKLVECSRAKCAAAHAEALAGVEEREPLVDSPPGPPSA